MQLIETVLSSIMIAIFISFFASSVHFITTFGKKVEIENKKCNQDTFIFNSFSAIKIEMKIEEWKKLCNALYPNLEIQVQKVCTKSNSALYVCEWNQKKAFLKIEN